MAGAGKRVLDFFYDVVSPYSWVGFETMCRYRSFWNVEVHLRPVLLGAIMKESGNQPPAMVPNKGVYMSKDLQRVAKYYQIPLRQPSDFFEVIIKKGSLSAMRFVTAIDLEQPNFLEPVSREIWKRIWSTDEDITTPESLLSAANKAGLPSELAQKLLEMSGTAAVKDRLRLTTAEAVKYGAFGMPTVVAHVDGKPHMFFGSDRFELLADLLGEKWVGPIPPGQKSLL
ncbi:glutathione S-transferase kappa 1 isoform X2 [Ambystoma mexicanum]|uniref:glutathione S-transferase kappa 1 isoform X2 n=1 Tax=Ambystoma mexicanum TaxID=8296 RepID=UPI0037E82F02